MIECKDTGEVVEKYEDYLLTKHWRNKRKVIIAERMGICEKCKKKIEENGKIHIHHLTYERIGDELAEDLMLLCENCHNKIHHKPKKKSKNAKRSKGKKRSCENCKYSQIMRYRGSGSVLYCNVNVCQCTKVCNKHKFGAEKRTPKKKVKTKKT